MSETNMSELEWLARNKSEWPPGNAGSIMVAWFPGGPQLRWSANPLDGYTREEWQAERQRLGLDSDVKESLTTEWDGEGLPPAGTECEVSNCGQPYAPCTIRYMGKSLCVVDHASHSDQHYHLSSVEFRPLRTKEQRERDELRASVYRYEALVLGREQCNELADFLYEQGYRKQEAQS